MNEQNDIFIIYSCKGICDDSVNIWGGEGFYFEDTPELRKVTCPLFIDLDLAQEIINSKDDFWLHIGFGGRMMSRRNDIIMRGKVTSLRRFPGGKWEITVEERKND